jgi:hypothetical protein
MNKYVIIIIIVLIICAPWILRQTRGGGDE